MGAIGNAIGGALQSSSEKDARRKALDTQGAIGDASVNALNKATAISNRGYTGYEGERVAGLAGNENKALDIAAKGADQSRGLYGKSESQIDAVAGNAWNSETAQKYMNPYVGQVVDQTLKRENTAYQQSQNQLKKAAISQGSFGGDRATLLEAAGTGKHLQAVGDITAQGYSQAYDKAFQGWQSDNQTKLSAAKAYDDVGGDISKLNSDQITDLMKTGQTDRMVRQVADDATYSSFIEKRDWDVNNLTPLLQSISVAKGGATAGPQQTSNAAGSIVGAISSIVGFFGKSSSNTQTTSATGSVDSSYGTINNTATASYSMGT